MSINYGYPVTGRLLGWKMKKPDSADEVFYRNALTRKALGDTGWERLTFGGDENSLSNNQVDESRDDVHDLLIRAGADGRLLILSSHSESVHEFLEKSSFLGELFSPAIETERLVEDLLAKPGEYVLSTVFARVDAFGNSLRTIALWGADLAEAALFQSISDSLQCFRATLRVVRTGQEVISVSSRGEIGFRFSSEAALTDVNNVLKFLSSSNYIDWSRQISLS